MYQPREIEDFFDSWRSFYRENDDRGEACINYVYGDQWDQGVIQDRALRGEESFIFNLSHNYLLRVKGDAAQRRLSLKFSGGNLDPKQMKEGQYVLKKMILCNDHLSAFQKVLEQVYDYGYGVMQVGTKQCGNTKPFEEPFLRAINNPGQAFFDVQAEDEFKTEGRYCGLKYKMSAKQLLLGEKNKAKARNKQICEVIDFWHREPKETKCYFDQFGQWHNEKIPNPVITKKVITYDVYFTRIIDGKIIEGPIKYYTQSKLPLVYWKGVEGEKRRFDTKVVKSLPFIYNLVDSQTMLNYVGSSIVGRLKKMGGTKVVVTDQMIEGKENFWSDYNRRSGVIQVNESDEGGMQQPLVLPADTLDATLLNCFQTSIQLMDQLAGVSPAMQGQQQATTNSGLQTQIMQGSLLQATIMSNHLRAVNEVGRILQEMIPEIVIEQRDIGEGLVINQRGKDYTPSNPVIRNDIKELFSEMMFEIVAGPSSEAEKSSNLMAIKEIIQTNPNIATYFADEFAANLNTSNSEDLKRRMQALMPPGIQEVGDGSLSLEEYRQMQQQQQQQQGPSPQEQQLEMQKQKMEGDQKAKQTELQLKAQKLQMQGAKDAKSLQIKEAGVIAKLSPKEVIFDTERRENANRKS